MTRATQQNKEEIKEIHREMERLTAALHHLAYENQRLRDEAIHEYERRQAEREKTREALAHIVQTKRHERDNLMLRLENELLKFERRLPQSKSNDEN